MTTKILISEAGKILYSKESIEKLKPIIDSNRGKEMYQTLIPCSELDYSKNLTRYYNDIILCTIHEPFKVKLNSRSIRHTNTMLLLLHAKETKPNAEVYDVVPVEDMTDAEKISFFSWCAVFALKNYNLNFPSSKDV